MMFRYTQCARRSGGIGRRARLKIVYREVCGFDSHLRHQNYNMRPESFGALWFKRAVFRMIGCVRRSSRDLNKPGILETWIPPPDKVNLLPPSSLVRSGNLPRSRAPFERAYATAASINGRINPMRRYLRCIKKHTIDQTGWSSTGASTRERIQHGEFLARTDGYPGRGHAVHIGQQSRFTAFINQCLDRRSG